MTVTTDVIDVDLVSMQAMEELGHIQLSRIVYRSLRNGAIMLKHNDGGG
jgi:hypothetical protein